MAFKVPAPRRAEKKQVKLKLGLQGPSGSGKTWAALALAHNIWPGARVCVIDTENDSASLYADKWEFDTIPLGPPFHSERYIACIDAVIKAGYDVLIIDSISHQWNGEGGILRRKEELDRRPGSNSYTNWASFTPEHTKFMEKLVQAPINTIVTMRGKQEYALQKDEKGKNVPVKMGIGPIQRDGVDYEFTLIFDIQVDHRATVDKNRTGLFDGEILDLAAPDVAERLRNWQMNGKGVPATPPAQPVPETQPVLARAASSQHSTEPDSQQQKASNVVTMPPATSGTHSPLPAEITRYEEILGTRLYNDVYRRTREKLSKENDGEANRRAMVENMSQAASLIDAILIAAEGHELSLDAAMAELQVVDIRSFPNVATLIQLFKKLVFETTELAA